MNRGDNESEHNYFFSFPKGMPWAKYDELGKRIIDKEEEMAKSQTRFPEINTRRLALIDEYRYIVSKLQGSRYRGELINVNDLMEAVVGAYYQGMADERDKGTFKEWLHK